MNDNFQTFFQKVLKFLKYFLVKFLNDILFKIFSLRYIF